MIVIHLIQDCLPTVANLPLWDFSGPGLFWHLNFDYSILAQQFDTDVFKIFRETTTNFYRSGQLWAMIAGIIIGYIIRGFTTYG